MKHKKKERLLILSFVAVVLSFGFSSCDYYRFISLDCINQTSLPVNVRYSIITAHIHANDSILIDTVCEKVASGASLKKLFVVPWGAKKTLCKKELVYFEFETPIKIVRFEGPEEVMKVFSLEGDEKDSYKFFITDSLFVSKK